MTSSLADSTAATVHPELGPSPYYQPTHQPSTPLDSTPAGEQLPVVVVGAGPVGMAVALGLAQRGIGVTLLEGANQVSFGSRAICVSRHSLEVADRLGFGEQIDAIALPWDGGRSYHRDAQVLHFQMPNEPHTVRGPMVNVSQSEFEQVMVERVEANPSIRLIWGAALSGVTQLDDGTVEVTATTEDGERTLRAAWVVAADGGRSAVREALGLRLQGQSYEGRYVIADIHWKSEMPTERVVWFDPPSNPGSTIIMHRQPNDIWRIDYQLDPSEDAEVETREDRIKARIATHLEWLGDDRPWTLEWHGFYQARALALESFTHDRVLFAGDAAHLVPIFGVRGLNSGMEDAETLAWMLASVVNGGADASLLQAYSLERHSAWEQNIANAGKSTLVMTPGSHGHRTTRDALLALAVERTEFSHLINPRQSSATHARVSPLTVPATEALDGVQPGEPVEDRRVLTADGKESSLHELRGTGFGIYGTHLDADALAAANELRSALAEAWTWESVSVIATLAEGTDAEQIAGTVLADAEGALAAALGARPGELFVVRPDGLLMARGRGAELVGILERLTTGGGAAHADVPETVVDVDPAEAAREKVWLDLSAGINEVPADDREGFMARLALLLGDRVGPDAFADAVAVASRLR